MAQNYIVFTEKKTIHFTSYEHSPMDSSFENSIISPLEFMKTLDVQDTKSIITAHDFFKFIEAFKPLKAAGGLVQSEGQWLLIHRNGFWDFPKGGMEEKEFAMQTALREVREECGIKNLMINDLTPLITYHAFERKGKWFMKETQWFFMSALNHEGICPQRAEGITQVVFADPDQVNRNLKNTYPMIQWLWA
ncbi:MAG: NUDIX domain-containing protein, partial [Flavobacteriia bacterium]|nr:NUDIX domain-containing protein [Flavobacteriia bacterium]